MRRFLIKEDNDLSTGQNEYAILSYDEETDKYHISIPPSVNPDDLPAIPGILARKGIREIDDKWGTAFRQRARRASRPSKYRHDIKRGWHGILQ